MGGANSIETGELWAPEIMYNVLFNSNTCIYVTHNVPIQPHKTCRQSSPSFSTYTFENSRYGGGTGLRGQRKYLFIISKNLHTHSLYLSKYFYLIVSHPGMYCVPNNKWIVLSSTRGKQWEFPRSLPHLNILGANAIGIRMHRTKCWIIYYLIIVWSEIGYIG